MQLRNLTHREFVLSLFNPYIQLNVHKLEEMKLQE